MTTEKFSKVDRSSKKSDVSSAKENMSEDVISRDLSPAEEISDTEIPEENNITAAEEIGFGEAVDMDAASVEDTSDVDSPESKEDIQRRIKEEKKRAFLEGAKKLSISDINHTHKPKPSFFRVLICVFISFVLAAGGILGISQGIKNARAIVKYEHVSLDEGMVNYLASYYKSVYIRNMKITGVKAEDSDAFWQSKNPDGISYGEHFDKSFREYLSSVVAAANIYLTYSHYTAEDKIAVTKTTEEILKFKADGSVDKFNEMAEKYHYDYDDFHNAAALLYKATRASEIIYGAGGVNLKNYPDLCEEYLQRYTHVSLLFVKINDEMSESDRAAKQEIIDTLSAAIEAKNTGNGMPITDIMFENYLKNSDGDSTMHDRGYYFRRGSEKTAEFGTAFPEIVEASFEMAVGEYRMVECSVGVCFIYKSDVTAGAYTDESNIFFSDFYSDASLYHYEKVLEALVDDVTFNTRYNKLAPLSIPVVEDFVIREFKSAR